jgi:hypothetical protein
MRACRHSPLETLAALIALLSLACSDSSLTFSAHNRPPSIERPLSVINHDQIYSETINAWDPDGDTVFVSAVALPSWLSFDSVTLVLSGLAGVENIGDHPVQLRAWDGNATDILTFTLTVRPGMSSLQWEGSWTAAGFYFGHDGHPYESDNFVVYSGFSSQEERQYVAEVLEGRFVDLKTSLGVSSHDEFEYESEDEHIDVLTLRYQGNDVFWTGQSYRYGLIVHAPDSPRYNEEGYTRDLYTQLLTHELMHVIEYLLVGTEGHYYDTEKWFHEGAAVYVAGPPPNQVRYPSQVEQWQLEMSGLAGGGNPVSVETWADFPEEIVDDAARIGRYYLFFELAFRYLVDPEGHGKTLLDVKNMYLDIREGLSFEETFENHMGMSVDYYETNFFDIIVEYLGEE